MHCMLDSVASGTGPAELGCMVVRERLARVKSGTAWLAGGSRIEVEALVKSALHPVRTMRPPQLKRVRSQPAPKRMMSADQIVSRQHHYFAALRYTNVADTTLCMV